MYNTKCTFTRTQLQVETQKLHVSAMTNYRFYNENYLSLTSVLPEIGVGEHITEP